MKYVVVYFILLAVSLILAGVIVYIGILLAESCRDLRSKYNDLNKDFNTYMKGRNKNE